jgi:hypothetical protein
MARLSLVITNKPGVAMRKAGQYAPASKNVVPNLHVTCLVSLTTTTTTTTTHHRTDYQQMAGRRAVFGGGLRSSHPAASAAS